jgi:hypothetical protein
MKTHYADSRSGESRVPTPNALPVGPAPPGRAGVPGQAQEELLQHEDEEGFAEEGGEDQRRVGAELRQQP